jgi:hypothetical protein
MIVVLVFGIIMAIVIPNLMAKFPYLRVNPDSGEIVAYYGGNHNAEVICGNAKVDLKKIDKLFNGRRTIQRVAVGDIFGTTKQVARPVLINMDSYNKVLDWSRRNSKVYTGDRTEINVKISRD